MLIAQLSDVHVGGGRYREELLRTAIAEINPFVLVQRNEPLAND